MTIIERDEAVAADLGAEWIATVIQGDATDPGIIDQAGVEDADVVAALTGESGINLAVCLAASELAADIRTVARINRATGEAYTRFVDAVLFPERAGARVAANAIVGSDIQAMAEVTGDLEIMLVRVAEGAPAAGKLLADVRLPAGSLIVSNEDGEQLARPDTELQPGRRYVVATEPDVADEVLNLLQG